MISGCTTYKEKFKAGTVADIGFFADSTVTMLGSLDLQNIVAHLEARLNAMHKVSQEIDPDSQDYLDTVRELKVLAKRSKTMVQEAQILMLIWVRAHRKMAAGTTDPADWFDLGESTKALLKSAPGAVL